jgi:thiol-disulfide isomerase/thioredoxin
MDDRTFFVTPRRFTALLLASSLIMFGMTGCQKETATADGTASDGSADLAEVASAGKTAADETSAKEILAKMVAAYRQADTYADAGQLHYEVVAGGVKQASDPVPMSVTFERPNRVRAIMFDSMAVSDGQQIHAAVQQVVDQVLEVPAPAKLTLTNFPPDEVLQLAMTAGRALFTAPQLGLLFSDDPLQAILSDAQAVTLLEDEKADGRACARVLVRRGDGKWIYWVDRQDSILRRVDLPTDELRKEIAPDEGVTELSIWVDMQGAQLNQPIDTKAFEFDVPAEAKRLTRFVTPIPGFKPQRLGEEIGDFEFTGLDGGKIDRKSLEGKIALVDFWFTTCPPCRQSMPLLETLYQKFKDNPKVVFLAVSVDRPDVSEKQITDTLQSWGATMPIARDSRNDGASVFQVGGAPSMFLLGADGKIQGYKVGLHADYDDVEAAINDLLQGKDVAAGILAEYDVRFRDYQSRMAAAAASGEGTVVEVPRVQIAPLSKPQVIALEKAWQCDTLKAPGNILTLSTPDQPTQIFVFDGWRTVVQLDLQGKEVARHELALPDRQAVSFLRTATDADGKRYFAATGIAQQQVHLLDDNWKLLWSFPEGKHAGIADVRIADLAGSGALQVIVGYWDVVGVQGVSLEGKRIWSNRNLKNALQLAIGDPGEGGRRKVVCVNSRGTLVPIDYLGKQQPDIRIPNRALINATAADVDGDGKVEWCGLAATGIDKRVVVGFDLAGNETWHYQLPDGVQQHQIEAIVPARLPSGDGGWLLPGADGSIHLLTKDGQLVDRFNYGAALAGLAIAASDAGPVLLVSSADGLTAWKISSPETH